MNMKCDKCEKPMVTFHWKDNAKLCDVCKHNSNPASWNSRDVEDPPATWENLKKTWEKQQKI